MASLTEQIEAVRAAFEASDKGFDAQKVAWAALGELTPQVDPADEDASMALCRFTRESLVLAGPWPTEAHLVLRAILPHAKRWMPVIDAERRISAALRDHTTALAKARGEEEKSTCTTCTTSKTC